MRKEGFVPAVLYGPGVKENIKLKFLAKEVEKALGTHAGTNVLVNLLVEGEKPMMVLFKSISRHPPERYALPHRPHKHLERP